MILDYEDTYMGWKEDELAWLKRCHPKTGAQVQDLQAGKLDGILDENEAEELRADIEKYYAMVFDK